MKTSLLQWYALGSLTVLAIALSPAQIVTPVPLGDRGTSSAERVGEHGANFIRTRFWNYGMVGDYPSYSPVNLAEFHSFEVPKGSGVNYSDGGTPFVLAKIYQTGDITPSFIMETGYRERQGVSPKYNRIMRYEPRPAYIQPDPSINSARSPAISNDPRTWPLTWPDRDHSWDGWWNGYFGKRPAADEESFCVADDQFYDAWRYHPDSRDSSRYGLAMRLEMRGFQWQNPQASYVLFTHYDVVNEGTTDYQDNIFFGIYFDSGVGGESTGCDGVNESEDDNAYWDRSTGINLTYTWDKYGHGLGLGTDCAPTGYLAYAYMETPGKPYDNIDNDDDGIVDERRDSGPGELVTYPGVDPKHPTPPTSPSAVAQGQQAIRTYISSHPQWNLQKFEAFYGPLEKRPAFTRGYWWTGDENMDWDWMTDDVGADNLPNTHDPGEGDFIPSAGEPHFDQTDHNESDQIGLTGFKMNIISPSVNPPTDNIQFFNSTINWPQMLYAKWTSTFPWDNAVAQNLNIGFLFASGPFTLKAGTRERFSLAAAFGTDLLDMYNNVKTVQAIYNANYNFAVPPPAPTVLAETGDHYVRLTWNDVSETTVNPILGYSAFEGYRIYRSADPDFSDVKVVLSGRGTNAVGNGKPIAQYDLKDGITGFSPLTIDGIAYYLGSDTDIKHTFLDTTVQNGQQYYYAVCAYDYGPTINFGEGSYEFYPSENAIVVTRTARGGTVLPPNVVAVRPNAKVPGYAPADASQTTHVAGGGTGSVAVRVMNSRLVPNGHLFKISFNGFPQNIHASSYNLIDSTTGTVLFSTGNDFTGLGRGLTGDGVLPVISTPDSVIVDTLNTGFVRGSLTNQVYNVTYSPNAKQGSNLLRTGYPDGISIIFSNTFADTSATDDPVFFPGTPSKFRVIAHTPAGDKKLRFFFTDVDGNGTLNFANGEYIDILTGPDSLPIAQAFTWRITPASVPGTQVMPAQGDTFRLKTFRPYGPEDLFTFTTTGEVVHDAQAKEDFKKGPYVVPNPYVGGASFEPAPYLESGRGERRMEFRGLPASCTVRIYTVHGNLVQTLVHEGTTDGYVAWNLRTKENLDVAPGLYIYHVDAGSVGTFIGKFAVIK